MKTTVANGAAVMAAETVHAVRHRSAVSWIAGAGVSLRPAGVVTGTSNLRAAPSVSRNPVLLTLDVSSTG